MTRLTVQTQVVATAAADVAESSRILSLSLLVVKSARNVAVAAEIVLPAAFSDTPAPADSYGSRTSSPNHGRMVVDVGRVTVGPVTVWH